MRSRLQRPPLRCSETTWQRSPARECDGVASTMRPSLVERYTTNCSGLAADAFSRTSSAWLPDVAALGFASSTTRALDIPFFRPDHASLRHAHSMLAGPRLAPPRFQCVPHAARTSSRSVRRTRAVSADAFSFAPWTVVLPSCSAHRFASPTERNSATASLFAASAAAAAASSITWPYCASSCGYIRSCTIIGLQIAATSSCATDRGTLPRTTIASSSAWTTCSASTGGSSDSSSARKWAGSGSMPNTRFSSSANRSSVRLRTALASIPNACSAVGGWSASSAWSDSDELLRGATASMID